MCSCDKVVSAAGYSRPIFNGIVGIVKNQKPQNTYIGKPASQKKVADRKKRLYMPAESDIAGNCTKMACPTIKGNICKIYSAGQMVSLTCDRIYITSVNIILFLTIIKLKQLGNNCDHHGR